MSQDKSTADMENTKKTAEWSLTPIDRVVFQSDHIKILTVDLYYEVLGSQRSDVLQPIIMQIFVALKSISEPTPAILTDLLRDLSVEHPDNNIRLISYSTMVSALISESEWEDTSDDMVLN